MSSNYFIARFDLPRTLGLEIDGANTVTLPILDDAHVAPLIAVARIVDPALRKTWEIDAFQAHLTNPEWAHGLDSLSTEIMARLGLANTPGVAMHLNKLLLVGQGGHVARHRDTDRMFATAVIQLPSWSEGGELVVYRERGHVARHAVAKFATQYLGPRA
ncbi:hypothetical protein GGF32_000927 [Allomyces javanicus]|nr:hypothetical protein GGF32_000927 [Allomyces javanicus]